MKLQEKQHWKENEKMSNCPDCESDKIDNKKSTENYWVCKICGRVYDK
jgi:transcription elongation factor Elf1